MAQLLLQLLSRGVAAPMGVRAAPRPRARAAGAGAVARGWLLLPVRPGGVVVMPDPVIRGGGEIVVCW